MIQRQPTATSRKDRPAKPYPDFPLFPHATGRWAKKIRGRFAFFGPWSDPMGALRRYLEQRDALYAGYGPAPRPRPAEAGPRSRTLAPAGEADAAGSTGLVAAAPEPPRALHVVAGPVLAGGLELRDLVNHFLTAKLRRVESGELTRRSFGDYYASAARLIKAFGAGRCVETLGPDDFAELRRALARTLGPVALGNTIGRLRCLFKHGFDAGLLAHPVRYGQAFAKPARRSLRLARAARGPRLFGPAEVHALLGGAGPQLRAMVLLGVNCGLGNTDVAELPRGALDLDGGILDFPRPKTGIARRAALWPETVGALRAVLAHRPRPRSAAHGDRVFVTKYGHPWVRVGAPGGRGSGRTQAVVIDAVVLEFGKLMRATGTHRPGRF